MHANIVLCNVGWLWCSEAANQIEEALRFIGCPYQLQAIQILDLDYEGVIPVVEWLINSIQKMKEDSKYKVISLLKAIIFTPR